MSRICPVIGSLASWYPIGIGPIMGCPGGRDQGEGGYGDIPPGGGGGMPHAPGGPPLHPLEAETIYLMLNFWSQRTWKSYFF